MHKKFESGISFLDNFFII